SEMPLSFAYWKHGAATMAAARGEELGNAATLNDTARAEFVVGLASDSRKTVEDKYTTAGIVLGIVLIAVIFGVTQNGWIALLLGGGFTLLSGWWVMLSDFEKEL